MIQIADRSIVVARTVFGWQRRTESDLGMVLNLRVVEEPPGFPWTRNHQMSGVLSDRSPGQLKFDYGAHTTGFGLDLDSAEARQLRDIVAERLPHAPR